MLLTAVLGQKRRIDNLLLVMTGLSLNSAPIDVGCLDVNHSSAPPTKALTKSVIDDNVFIFFKVGSIEGQVLSWKSIPPICSVLQDPDYKSGAVVVMLLRAAVLLEELLLDYMDLAQVEQVSLTIKFT